MGGYKKRNYEELRMRTQKEMIKEAMQAIAARKPGRSRLVYDKTKHTIVAISVIDQTKTELNIAAQDADMDVDS